MTNLGVLDEDHDQSLGLALSDDGSVVGSSNRDSAGGVFFPILPTLWRATDEGYVPIELPRLNEDRNAEARGINGQGRIVGNSGSQGLLWEPDADGATYTVVGLPGEAFAINGSGWIAALWGSDAAILTPTAGGGAYERTLLPRASGTERSRVSGINEAGSIAGWMGDVRPHSADQRGVVWRRIADAADGALQYEVHELEQGSAAFDKNAAGLVAGWFWDAEAGATIPCVWSWNGASYEREALPLGDGTSGFVRAVNDRGLLAGELSGGTLGRRAAVWAPTADGYRIAMLCNGVAWGINEDGLVAGSASFPDVGQRAVTFWAEGLEPPVSLPEELLAQAIALLQAMPHADLLAPGHRAALQAFIRQAIAAIEDGDTDEAKERIGQAIHRTDGWPLRGSPDGAGPGSDWVVGEEAAIALYELLIAAFELL